MTTNTSYGNCAYATLAEGRGQGLKVKEGSKVLVETAEKKVEGFIDLYIIPIYI